MTLIGGTQINWKRTLFTDDCLTVGEAKISSSEKYRPKLREVYWKNCHLIIASCWSTKDIDFTINMIEAEVNCHKAKDTLGLQFQIQTVLLNSMKALKEIRDDPQFSFLILETTTNTLWATEEYSMFQVGDDVDIVFGSAEQNFHQISHKGFLEAFIQAVEVNEYCDFPVYVYRDNNLYTYEWLDDVDAFRTFLLSLWEENGWKEQWEKVHSKTASPNERGDSWEICNLWSWGWLSSEKTTKLW